MLPLYSKTIKIKIQELQNEKKRGARSTAYFRNSFAQRCVCNKLAVRILSDPLRICFPFNKCSDRLTCPTFFRWSNGLHFFFFPRCLLLCLPYEREPFFRPGVREAFSYLAIRIWQWLLLNVHTFSCHRLKYIGPMLHFKSLQNSSRVVRTNVKCFS